MTLLAHAWLAAGLAMAHPTDEASDTQAMPSGLTVEIDDGRLDIRPTPARRCVPVGLSVVEALPLGAPTRSMRDACLVLRLEAAGRGTLAFPAVGLSRRLELARGRIEFALEGPGPISARVALISTRSAGNSGYLGIDGEAILPKLQIAEARVDWAQTGLAAAAGLIDDPFLMAVQTRWGLRYAAPLIDQVAGLSYRSDLGAWLGWTGPRGIASLTMAMTTGEGADLRDRNNGVNTHGMLIVRPFAWLDPDRVGNLELGLYGREGSRGVDAARDHRVGGFVTWRHKWVGAGLTTQHGWGLDADGDRLPSVGSLFVRTGDALPAIGWVRVDGTLAQRGDPDSTTIGWRVGGGPLLPWRKTPDQPAPLYLAIAYEGASIGPNATAVPGGDAASLRHEIWLQLGARLGLGVPLTAVSGQAAP